MARLKGREGCRFGSLGFGAGLDLSLKRKRIKLYSVQNLRRLHPDWFRNDLQRLFELLQRREIEPIIAERIALDEVVQAHEKLGRGEVIGKIVIDMT